MGIDNGTSVHTRLDILPICCVQDNCRAQTRLGEHSCQGEFRLACEMQDGDGSTTCFIDRGVYTRNRAFRLMLSSKAGKTSILKPTGTDVSARPS